MRRLSEPSDIAKMVGRRAQALQCLAVGANPNGDWAEEVRVNALHIVALADELEVMLRPVPVSEAN